jgi:membrane fusion protein, multidrug efflux system
VETAQAQRAAAIAQVNSAQSNLDNAKLQLSYTTLYAPTAGRVAKKTLEAGQRVQPSQSVVAVVERYVWVVANFKETQLARIQPGQRVKVVISTPFQTGLSTESLKAFSGQRRNFHVVATR